MTHLSTQKMAQEITTTYLCADYRGFSWKSCIEGGEVTGIRASWTGLLLTVKLTPANQQMYPEKTFLHDCKLRHMCISCCDNQLFPIYNFLFKPLVV